MFQSYLLVNIISIKIFLKNDLHSVSLIGLNLLRK